MDNLLSMLKASDRGSNNGHASTGEHQLGDDSLKAVLPLQSSGKTWSWQGRTQVMGILNITPDSFSDGGLSSQNLSRAVEAAKQLAGDGADVIDIGGQSTRPGADLIAAEEECNRVIPIIRQGHPSSLCHAQHSEKHVESSKLK